MERKSLLETNNEYMFSGHFLVEHTMLKSHHVNFSTNSITPHKILIAMPRLMSSKRDCSELEDIKNETPAFPARS